MIRLRDTAIMAHPLAALRMRGMPMIVPTAVVSPG